MGNEVQMTSDETPESMENIVKWLQDGDRPALLATWCHILADRIKAAYGHEVAELRRRAESAELDAALWAGSAKAAEEKLRELRSATLGNTAKLRKALERIMCYNERDDDEFGVMARFLAISRECKTALAAPPRNCDKYETEDDAVAAYENESGTMGDARALCWWLYYAEGGASAGECARIEAAEKRT